MVLGVSNGTCLTFCSIPRSSSAGAQVRRLRDTRKESTSHFFFAPRAHDWELPDLGEAPGIMSWVDNFKLFYSLHPADSSISLCVCSLIQMVTLDLITSRCKIWSTNNQTIFKRWVGGRSIKVIAGKWSTDAAFLFKAMIRLSCHTPRDCIWILHEGIQYFASHKEMSFQRRHNHKQSSNIKGKLPINKTRRAPAHKRTAVQNLTCNTSVQLKLFFFLFVSFFFFFFLCINITTFMRQAWT